MQPEGQNEEGLFCATCVAESTAETSGNVSTVNGIGRTFYGKAEPCAEDKTFAPWLLSGLTDSIYGAKDPPDPQRLTTLEVGQTLQIHVSYLGVPNANQHPKLMFADVP